MRETWTFNSAGQVVFGPGAATQLGDVARRLRLKRVSLVTDRNLRAAGMVDDILSVLKRAEIEVSVLGNENPLASVVGEIIPGADFYSYEAKYELETSTAVIPANLSLEQSIQIQDLAVRAYQAIDCAGMARVDFLMEKDSKAIYLNEVNTIPGFTKISMYPKLWQASGMTYPQLVDRLIELAFERKHERDNTVHIHRRNV